MKEFRLTKNLGMVLLGIWLIVTGLLSLLHVSFQGLYVVMALFAIVTGVVILFER